jgi:hypothetical protein
MKTNWTVKLEPEQRDWIQNTAAENGCSAGKMIEWFISLCQKDDVILDAVIKYAKLKSQRL